MENRNKKLIYIKELFSFPFAFGFLFGMIVVAVIPSNSELNYYNYEKISRGDRYQVSSFKDPETGGRYLVIKGQDKELVVIPDKNN